jgi:hypothetical protein
MPYIHVTEKEDYSDLASGRVLYNTPGYPAFPVRLASEIFQRCQKLLGRDSSQSSYVIFDPVCGGSYLLSVLAFLHWESIQSIFASDIDNQILVSAEKNLGLLSLQGMDNRIDEIKNLMSTWRKESHAAALDSALRLRRQLVENQKLHQIQIKIFQADILNPHSLPMYLREKSVDIVIADVPYGIRSTWIVSQHDITSPVSLMLTNLLPFLSEKSIVVISADKHTKVTYPKYRRRDRFQIGKRRITILSALLDQSGENDGRTHW